MLLHPDFIVAHTHPATPDSSSAEYRATRQWCNLANRKRTLAVVAQRQFIWFSTRIIK